MPKSRSNRIQLSIFPLPRPLFGLTIISTDLPVKRNTFCSLSLSPHPTPFSRLRFSSSFSSLFFDLAIDHTNDYYLTVVIDSTNELTKDTYRERER